MDEIAIGFDAGRSNPRLVMECGGRRFPVVAMGMDGCLIDAQDGCVPRGFADIFDGDRHVAQCLIVLAAPEGPYLRCAFKRRTESRPAPPRDFADPA
ncbi:hypothetical protein [Amaricoccus sp.]|uniref:hypothetical protein n=1 Tax=Amaricoccus sp. TaxID=1872485 RepID=UPI002611F945|nr:hypothetical protein [Amaricoccus sp.]HRO10185.1 hypothetical protein [Amaricoccus sp.]